MDEQLSVDTADVPPARLIEIDAPGPVEAVLSGGKACFWFRAADQSLISLVWPAGSTARSDPSRVLDRAGRVLVTRGDTGLSFSGSLPEGRPGCVGPDSRTLVIESVTRS